MRAMHLVTNGDVARWGEHIDERPLGGQVVIHLARAFRLTSARTQDQLNRAASTDRFAGFRGDSSSLGRQSCSGTLSGVVAQPGE